MRITSLFLVLFLLVCPGILAQGSWTHMTEINGHEIGFVFSIETKENGETWISSMWRNESNEIFYNIFHFQNGEWINESENLIISGYAVTDIDIAPNGNVWFCQGKNLVKFDGENWYYNDDAPHVMQDIDVDIENNVWCSTDQGVLKYDGTDWEIYTTESGLVRNGVTHLVLNPDGIPWIRYGDPLTIDGSFYGGVSYLNGDTWITFDDSNGLVANQVYDISFDQDGSVYISHAPRSSTVSGISVYDGVTWKKITSNFGTLEFDTDGTLWVTDSTTGHDIYKYNGITWSEYHADSPAFMNGFTAIHPDGSVWLGTNDGILIFDSGVTSIQEKGEKPQKFTLDQNYPNPFNASTTITYTLPAPSPVTLTVYSLTGQKIATLIDEPMSEGTHTALFDGSGLSSGLYFARIAAGGMSTAQRMLLVK